MKILIAIPCLNRGGTEIQTLNLAQLLCKRGFEVSILCYYEHDKTVVKEYQKAGCSVEILDLKRSISPLKLLQFLKVQFRKINPDIIHVQYMAPGMLPIIAAKLSGVKTIFATVHQPWTKNSHGIKAKLFLRFSSLLCTRFITVSVNAEKSWFGKSTLLNPAIPDTAYQKHFTIHNAVDIEKVDACIARAKGLTIKMKSESFVVAAVSRLRHEKGIDVLLKGFSLFVSKFPGAYLQIIGDGPDKEGLVQMAENLGIAPNVYFHGSKNWEEAMQLISAVDVVVCPSRFEGFGLAAAEAMACCKPVIASEVDGLKEVVANGETGVLFSVDDEVALSQAMEKLYLQPALVKSMGEQGRQRVEQLFSMDVYSQKTNYLYKIFQ